MSEHTITTLTDFTSNGLLPCDPPKDDLCPICHEPFTSPIRIRACNHIFDRHCLLRWLERSPTCPICRCVLIDRKISVASILSNPNYSWADFGVELPNDVSIPTYDIVEIVENPIGALLSAPADARTIIRADAMSRALVIAGNVAVETARLHDAAFTDDERAELSRMVRAMHQYVRVHDGQGWNVRSLPIDMLAGAVRRLRAEGHGFDIARILVDGLEDREGERVGRRLLQMAFMATWVTWQGVDAYDGDEGVDV